MPRGAIANAQVSSPAGRCARAPMRAGPVRVEATPRDTIRHHAARSGSGGSGNGVQWVNASGA